MLEFLKKPLFVKKEIAPNEEKLEIKLADIPPEIYDQLEQQFYEKFDFMKLYTPSVGNGLIATFGLHIIIGLNALLVLLLLWKK